MVANGAGDLDFFTETNRDKYKMQRRLIGPIYSTGSLEKHEDRLDSTVSRLVASLKRLDGKVIDVGEWLHMFILGMPFHHYYLAVFNILSRCLIRPHNLQKSRFPRSWQ